MKVRFVQSGGFGGLVRQHELNTAELPPEDAHVVRELVSQSALARSGVHCSETGRDLHQYDITIEDGDRSIEVTFDDATAPQQVRPLIAYLKKRTRPASVIP